MSQRDVFSSHHLFVAVHRAAVSPLLSCLPLIRMALLGLLAAAAVLAASAHSEAEHEAFLARFLRIEHVGDATSPEQIWINYGATPDSMVIGWLTNSTAESMVQFDVRTVLTKSAPNLCTNSIDCSSNLLVVQTNPNGFGFNATGNATQYTSGSYTSGYIHRVTLTGLQANTQYTYRVGGQSTGWSSAMTFTSNVGVGASLFPYRFGVIGDLGQTNNSNATIWHVLSATPTVQSVFITGDLSYADGFQPRWDSFQRLIQPLSSSIPVQVCPGNHEIESYPPFQAYVARFAGMPFKAGSPDGAQYYSYETGPVHVIALNSFGIYSTGSPQYTWLQADIASIDRSKTPWVIVILHAPWYNSNADHTNDGQLMRLTLEGMLHEAQVAMVFAGHVHAYERSFPVYNNTLDATGAVYITIGDGGNREGLYKNWLSPQPTWSAFRESEYGHGILTIVNATHAAWEWHRDIDTEPTISDSVFVMNPYKA